MHNVLIVGNVTKDVYLRLDNRLNHFEKDQNDIDWLDISFNNSTHNFYSRVSIYGGASITLEVMSRFKINSRIAGTPAAFTNGRFVANETKITHRYILCKDDHISYLSPSERPETIWREPPMAPEWIYIDRSANIDPRLAESLLKYLTIHSNVKLALYVSQYTNQHANHIRDLIKRAQFIITDTKAEFNNPDVVRIDKHYISYQNERVAWNSQKHSDVMTKLSSNLTIAASMLGAIILGRKPASALLIARANITNSKLSGTTNLEALDSIIIDDYYRVEKLTNNKETNMSEIEANAKALMTPGKGILAADESGGSIHKKFESMNIPDDEQHRRDYRNLFFTTPDLEKYVSGVILFDETARQLADDGTNFIDFLKNRGVISGIKVDQGLVNFENSDEKYTQGLDGLPERLAEYYNMGARFAKWRAAFELTDHSPSDMAIQKNNEILAQYAIDCQNAGIVPIVEPELVYDGDYTIEQNAATTTKILKSLFTELAKKNVNLKGCILKCNMVLAGKKQAVQSTPEEVGRATAAVLRDCCPDDLAGVVFLSGGQSVTQATENLQAITNEGPFAWGPTFSYARALQDPALQAWQGDNNNADAAREGFRLRLIANTEALIKK